MPKKLLPPFDLNAKFPTPIQRFTYRVENWFFNRLYPISPPIFCTSVAAVAAFHYRFPNNYILSLLPESGSPYVGALKIALASLVTAYMPVLLIRRFLKHVLFTYKGFIFDKPKKPSLPTKIWGVFMGALKTCVSPRLHSCDLLLPNLPLPSLSATIDQYLESVEQILDKTQFQDVKQLADGFRRNEGRKLQRFARIYWFFTDNYVTNFWQKYAYLYHRDSLLVKSSVGHADLFRDIPASQALRAAHLVYNETMSALAIDRQRFRPLANGMMCAKHYDNLYSITRKPDEQIDKLVKHGITQHVLIIHNGCFYKLNVFDDRRRAYNIDQLTVIFEELLSRTEPACGGEHRLAALTTDERAQWARNRRRFFLEVPQNAKSLEIIESALFVVNLDDKDYDYQPNHPEFLDRYMKAMLTGNGTNRWLDKSLNYSVSRNARVGGTLEHSICDGIEFGHIWENGVYVDTNFLKYPGVKDNGPVQLGNGLVDGSMCQSLKFAEQLQFEITDEMRSEIDRCYKTVQGEIDDVDMAATVFREFGKGLVKKGNVSPDAFVQMAIQLANYRDQGKFVLTYEAASSRFFANSRTETLRTVSKDSCAFVRSMLDENCTNEERLRLLRIASESHGHRNRECMIGKGVDRHLFVLYVLAKGTNTSSPFLEYVLGQPWLLSTSQTPTLLNYTNEDELVDFSWLGACFGAVAKEGYGICYRFAGNHSICIHITSYKSAQNTDSHRFQRHLIDSFKAIAEIFA